MTKDYAKRRSSGKKARKAKQNSYFLTWIVTIALFILFTFGLAYVGKHQHQLRQNAKTAAKHSSSKIAAVNATVANETLTPKFDFYTILPQKNKNAIVPRYELEIAAVKTYEEADKLKAELALLGVEVNVISAKRADTQIYNIGMGPYDNKEAALSDQLRLRQNNIKSVIKKLK